MWGFVLVTAEREVQNKRQENKEELSEDFLFKL